LRPSPHSTANSLFPFRSREGVFGLPFPEGQSEEGLREWLHASVNMAGSQGARELYAPIQGSTWRTYRLRTDPDDGVSLFWEPPRLPQLEHALRAEGFEVAMRYHSHFFRTQQFNFDWKLTTRSAEMVRRKGYSIVPLLPLLGPQTLARLHEVTLAAFEGNFLFEPIDFGSFSSIYGNKDSGIDASLSRALLDESGRIMGYVYAFRQDAFAVIKTICVDPIVMKRLGSGLWSASYALVADVNIEVKKLGVDWYVSALTADDASSRFMAKACGKLNDFSHSYALYVRRFLNGVPT
jgi:hypothetical protein